MRRVLIDYERKLATPKRGGKFVHSVLDDSVLAIEDAGIAWVDWRDALEGLAVDFSRQALAIELRYMLAMPIAEIVSGLAVIDELFAQLRACPEAGQGQRAL